MWKDDKRHENLSVLKKEHRTKDQQPGLTPRLAVNELNDH